MSWPIASCTWEKMNEKIRAHTSSAAMTPPTSASLSLSETARGRRPANVNKVDTVPSASGMHRAPRAGGHAQPFLARAPRTHLVPSVSARKGEHAAEHGVACREIRARGAPPPSPLSESSTSSPASSEASPEAAPQRGLHRCCSSPHPLHASGHRAAAATATVPRLECRTRSP